MTKSEHLKAKRKELNLTQPQLANKMGFPSYFTVAQHESGRRKISDSVWAHYCLVLGIEEEKDGRED